MFMSKDDLMMKIIENEIILEVDKSECTLKEFMKVNCEDVDVCGLTNEEIQSVINLKINESVYLGMFVEVKRIK
jgi:hypothetical protein